MAEGGEAKIPGHAEVKAVSTSTLRRFSMMRVAWISKSLRMMKE